MTRWILRILGGLLTLIVLACGAIWFQSNRVINAKHPFREYAITVPTDSAGIAQGYHVARIRCMGCHRDSLKGDPAFVDEPMLARIAAPNVPFKLASLTDAEFAGFLRYAVRKDGTSPFIMPPPNFYHLSDADIGALIAYIRTLPVPDEPLRANSYGLLGRFGVATGQFKTAVFAYDTTQERVGQDPSSATTRRGEYLARSICAECHGARLTGEPGEPPTPSLSGALAYAPEQFVTLLRTGTPRDTTTKLTLMAEVAKGALTYLTDEEISALYGYLKAMPHTGVER